MHSLETIKLLNTKAAIQGVSRRAKAARKAHDNPPDVIDLGFEDTADRALGGDINAWDAMVAELARREAE